MRLFLVDFENVQGKGLLGIDKLKHNDEVVIFYSKNANKLSFDEMHLISASNAKIKYIEIETLGHNALDFNLVMYIGVITGKFRGTHLDINIVSNDTGFDTLKNNQKKECGIWKRLQFIWMSFFCIIYSSICCSFI